MKKKVLLFAPFFTPSVKGGGPIISTKNLIENLSEKIDFYVLTSDRDLGDTAPFPNVETEKWNEVGQANVMYVNRETLNVKLIATIMKEKDFDYFYLNSFFDSKFSILPILAKRTDKKINGQLIVAPRGEFSPGALNIKAQKKNVYIRLFKLLGLAKSFIWHATAESEKNDIRNIFGNQGTIKIANNLTANYADLNYQKNIEKTVGTVKFVFISRIHPKKNLLQALQLVGEMQGNIEFSIYGPLEDKNYWAKCQSVSATFPESIQVKYHGLLNHAQIIPTFMNQHFFLFPTFGENYGHVISEALIGGCPVIISDQTPWRQLEAKGAGWDIALDNIMKFKEVLQECVDMNQTDYQTLSKSAFEFGKTEANKADDIAATYGLFGSNN